MPRPSNHRQTTCACASGVPLGSGSVPAWPGRSVSNTPCPSVARARPAVVQFAVVWVNPLRQRSGGPSPRRLSLRVPSHLDADPVALIPCSTLEPAQPQLDRPIQRHPVHPAASVCDHKPEATLRAPPVRPGC